MKQKNGFTLIELLAVIVILAIIALIATPMILSVIDSAKKGAAESSTYGYIDAIEKSDLQDMIDTGTYQTKKDGTYDLNTIGTVNYKGKSPALICVIMKDGSVESGYFKFDYYIVEYKNGKAKVNSDLTTIDCTNKAVYKESLLNGADPEVGTGMIPVTIENDGTVKKADIYTEWYNYDSKKWANVVTVTESSRSAYNSATAGTIVAEKDILTYFVWIPRYSYTLWNVNGDATGTQTSPFTISITFENKTTAKANGNTNGEKLTHPAFTFGTQELNGFWVGKFETGYRQTDDMTPTSIATWTKAGAQQANADATKVVIKPNVNSWRNITLSNMFKTTQSMSTTNNIFGLATSSDGHMMKNSEWGAVAYLSHSIYGINGQIKINNNSNFVTGCAATVQDAASVASCENAYNTTNGYTASTTGNITGIYDMSGGAWEYVMGYTTGATTVGGFSQFTVEEIEAFTTGLNQKYMDKYETTNSSDYELRKLGDATKEMGPFIDSLGSWYADLGGFANSANPFSSRGGCYSNWRFAGVFSSTDDTGGLNSQDSFRFVALGR